MIGEFAPVPNLEEGASDQEGGEKPLSPKEAMDYYKSLSVGHKDNAFIDGKSYQISVSEDNGGVKWFDINGNGMAFSFSEKSSLGFKSERGVDVGPTLLKQSEIGRRRGENRNKEIAVRLATELKKAG